MKLRAQRSQWDRLGRTDPLWAIITDPARRNGGWDLEEFFASGAADARQVMAWAAETGCPALRRNALDFGCGVGRVTQALAEHFEQVIGIDIAPAMLELARKHNRHGDRCRYMLNEHNHLRAFSDGSFDLVHSRLTLQHQPRRHIRAYLRELVRVARPGGLIVIQLPYTHRYRGIAHFVLHNVYGTVARKILRHSSVMDMYALPPGEVVRILEQAGASVLRVLKDERPEQEWPSAEYLATLPGEGRKRQADETRKD